MQAAGLGAFGDAFRQVRLEQTDSGLTLAFFQPKQLAIVARSGQRVRAADVGNGHIVAKLDGPMYGPGGRLLYRHLDRGAGIDVASTYPSRGATVSVVGNRAVVSSGAVVAAGADVAVQGYPTLVWDGSVTPAGGDEHVWRAGLAQMRDGQLAFAIGRMPMGDFARALAQAGAWRAVYTDGGGSTSLVADGQRMGDPENRAVATWLLVERQVPVALYAGLGAAALGLGLLLWAALRAPSAHRNRAMRGRRRRRASR